MSGPTVSRRTVLVWAGGVGVKSAGARVRHPAHHAVGVDTRSGDAPTTAADTSAEAPTTGPQAPTTAATTPTGPAAARHERRLGSLETGWHGRAEDRWHAGLGHRLRYRESGWPSADVHQLRNRLPRVRSSDSSG